MGETDDHEIRSNPRKELVREQLINIAAELFDKKGYAQTSFNDIAAAMGLGRSALYHYFRNKEEMLAALVEAEALEPSHHLHELRTRTDLSATERLRRAISDGIVRRLSEGSRFILLSRLEAQIPAELSGLYNQSRRQIYDDYVGFIEDGIASGEFRQIDAKIAAFAVIGMANWTSRWYSPKGVKTPQEIAEVITDMAMKGLVAERKADTDRADLREAVEQLRADLSRVEGLVNGS